MSNESSNVDEYPEISELLEREIEEKIHEYEKKKKG